MAIGDKRPVVMEADRAVAGGVATLGADGKLLDAQIPGLDKLGAAPAVESKTYPGCYYRTTNGVVEWLNPPMKEGVEYRTTERYLGKPVYVKVIDFGALPAATYKGVSHGVSDVDKMFPPYGQTSDNWSIPTKSYGGSMNDTVGTTVDVTMSKTDIYINTNRDRSSATATVVIKYTKTTD